MKTNVLLLLIFLFVVYSFMCYLVAPFIDGFLKKFFSPPSRSVVLFVIFSVVWWLIAALLYCIFRNHNQTERNYLNEESQPITYGSGQNTSDFIVDDGYDNCVVETEDEKTEEDNEEMLRGDTLLDDSLECAVARSTLDRFGQRNKSFRDVKMRKKTDLQRRISSRRFAFYPLPESSEENEGGILSVPRQDSFVGLPEFTSFETYLHMVAIDSPLSPLTPGPLTPRQQFYRDLIETAASEDKLRFMMIQSITSHDGQVHNSPVSEGNTLEDIGTIMVEDDEDNSVGEILKKNEALIRRWSRSNLPSIIEVCETLDNRMSIKASVAEEVIAEDDEPAKETSTVPLVTQSEHETESNPGDDEVFTPQKETTGQFFVSSASQPPNFTTEAVFTVEK